jgi:two-component system response regulator VicR
MIKILYVEDEVPLAKIVKESLESRQFEVRLVHDGAAVLPALKDFAPDVCVLDVMLPRQDGFSVGQELRRRYPALPIIFLTAKNQTADVVQGFSSGGNDYIRKPFSMEELIVRIHNLLKLAKAGTPAFAEATAGKDDTIALGSYTFLPKRYELRRGTAVRKLSHREAQLLRLFASQRDQAIERRYVLQTLWGDDSIFNSRNLDVYVARLRDYLKEDPDVQIITLKGVGYHFTLGQE